MSNLTLQRSLSRRTCELISWQRGAIGLLILSAAVNMVYTAALMDARSRLDSQAAKLEQAERTRDYAIEQLGAMALQAERDKQARAEQAAAYEALGAYTYIGECTITAYCPCAECCGPYADGLTATGVPAGPGIVAVDPDVIPLGSVVIIDGQRLAADTGGAIKGKRIDVCQVFHEAAAYFGVQTAEVWVITDDLEMP